MNALTLRQLRYFEALAEHRHFGAAAGVCAVSQPALSMQIKELEEHLGLPLFERQARNLRLTPFGEDFARRARTILQTVDEIGELARAAQSGLSGRLRIGVIPTVAPYLLPRLIPALHNRHAGLDIHIRETLTPRLIDELNKGQIDTAILALPTVEPTLTEVALFSEDFVLVRPRGATPLPMPRAETLCDMRLLLLEEGHCFRDQTLAYCAAGPARPRDGLDGSSLSTLVQMVGAGIGVTLLPEMAIDVETRSAAVTVTRFADPPPRRTIGMVWRKTSPLSAALTEVADVVRAAGAPMDRRA